MEFSAFYHQIETYSRQINESEQEILLPFLNHYELTFLQFQLLHQVQLVRQITVGKLAKVMALDAGNVSAYCKKLEQKELLKKVRSIDDERVVQLALTEKSKQLLSSIDAQLIKRCQHAWEAFSQDEVEHILKGLQQLKHFLDTILKEGLASE